MTPENNKTTPSKERTVLYFLASLVIGVLGGIALDKIIDYFR